MPEEPSTTGETGTREVKSSLDEAKRTSTKACIGISLQYEISFEVSLDHSEDAFDLSPFGASGTKRTGLMSDFTDAKSR